MGSYKIHTSDSRIREPLWSIPFNYSNIHITILFLSRQKEIQDFDNMFPKEILKWGSGSDKTWITEPKLFYLWNPFFCFYQNVCSLSGLPRCFSSIKLCISNTNIIKETKVFVFGICWQRTGVLAVPASVCLIFCADLLCLINISELWRINEFLYLLGVTAK